MKAVSILVCGLHFQQSQLKPQMPVKAFIRILKVIFMAVIFLFIYRVIINVSNIVGGCAAML
jgi:hypothetical protein